MFAIVEMVHGSIMGVWVRSDLHDAELLFEGIASDNGVEDGPCLPSSLALRHAMDDSGYSLTLFETFED